ncbi:MAG: hypothetical protein Q4C13_03575 [Clostridia bacterium]|nr:hypothetical protein [Clostridia bacterium]
MPLVTGAQQMTDNPIAPPPSESEPRQKNIKGIWAFILSLIAIPLCNRMDVIPAYIAMAYFVPAAVLAVFAMIDVKTKNKKKGLTIAAIVILSCCAAVILSNLIEKSGNNSSQADAGVSATSIQTSEHEEEKSQEAYVIDDVGDLLNEYEENGIAAQEKYEGKIVILTGVVDSVGVDVADKPYVKISDGSGEFFQYAQCYFSTEAEIAKAAQLKKGDVVTITGTVGNYFVFLSIKNCAIG